MSANWHCIIPTSTMICAKDWSVNTLSIGMIKRIFQKPEVEWGKWVSKSENQCRIQCIPAELQNGKHFDYDLYPKNVVKFLTDSLHGLSISIKTKIDAIQFITLLGCDGALIPNRTFDQTQSKTAHLELQLYYRCKNFLFGISDNIDGLEPDLTEIGFAACLFYFLSFDKPDFTEIIFEISKKTTLNACNAVFVNWSIGEACPSPDHKIAEFIKNQRDEQLIPLQILCRDPYWMNIQMKRIRKIYNVIQPMPISCHFSEIDKLTDEFVTF